FCRPLLLQESGIGSFHRWSSFASVRFVPRSVATKPHPLLRAFQGAGSVAIPIPWAVDSGLGIGDVLVGEPLQDLPEPAGGERFAPVNLTFDDGELTFIAQRSTDAEIV